MKVLILTNSFSTISSIIEEAGDSTIVWHQPIDKSVVERNQIEFVVSHGYRHIVQPSVIDSLKGRIINLHISLLPWNRGADPNLWSFLDNTPKGVTIHYIDNGIDTGDIIAQKQVVFVDSEETLSSTYKKLQEDIRQLFGKHWASIRKQECVRCKQASEGTFHRSSDKDRYQHLLIKGWDTPVSLLTGKGKTL